MPALTEHEIRQSPLWNHMTKVLSSIISERPANPIEALETTSSQVITGSAVPPKNSVGICSGDRLVAKANLPADAFTNTRWAAHFTQTLAPPKPPRILFNGEEAQEEPNEVSDRNLDHNDIALEADDDVFLSALSDVVSEQRIFNTLGTGVSPEEAYRILIGLRQLMKAEPLASAQLWGKILGSKGDYYVAETVLDLTRVPHEDVDQVDTAEEEDLSIERVDQVLFAHAMKRRHATPAEESGTGLNKYIYYAAHATDPMVWIRLPDVSPHHIVVARLIRNSFTGDLDAPVHSHPRFLGVEKHYLRAQIARITCSCRIAPKDAFIAEGAMPEVDVDDEGNPLPPPEKVPAYTVVPPLLPQEAPDEEDTEAIQLIRAWYDGFSHGELLQAKHWVHIAPTLLESGRVTLPPPPLPDLEEDEEVEASAEGEQQPHIELIRPLLSEISKDDPMTFPGHSRSQFVAWVFRQGYHNESSNSTAYLVRSMRWPGAVSYAVTTKRKPSAVYQFLYIGNGLKNLQGADYAPQLPPRRLLEYPESGLLLQRDYTPQEEQAYVQPSPTSADEVMEEDDETGETE